MLAEGMMFSLRKKSDIPSSENALPGRDTPMPVPEAHFVNGRPLPGGAVPFEMIQEIIDDELELRRR